jgi:hypothetical protein
MCRKLICSVSFIIVLGLASYVSAQDEVEAYAEIPFTTGAPILDGVVDSTWVFSAEHLINTLSGEGGEEVDDANDCSGSWRALWDTEYLYVLVDVNDETLVQDSDPAEGWSDDRVEIFVDGDNSKDDVTDMENDYQYCFRWNYAEVETPVEWYFRNDPKDSLEGVEYAVAETGDGYLFEIKLPWSTLIGGPPQEYQFIGIEVMIGDDDDGGGRDTQLSWSEGARPHVPSGWGTAQLVPGPSDWAANPKPVNGQTDVPLDTVLRWLRGGHSAEHDVYFGTDFNDVNEATRENDPNGVLVSQSQLETTYDPTEDPNDLLDLNTTYHWRVDEFNDVEPNSPWKGDVWSFTTRNYIIVDDFEDYNDYEPDRIFDTWVDGWGVAENGAQVGYDASPYAEQTIVHGGSQSMPFSYTSTSGVAYSEAVRTFETPQDWTKDGADKLTLFFRGYPKALVEDPISTYTMSASGADVWDESDEFRYAYKMLSGNGSITARVVSVENTNEWAKAGVMIRETLDAFSPHGFMFITPGGRRAFQNRATTGWESYSAHSEPNGISVPGWVRLVRQGIFITAYYSEDGVNWIQQPTDENTGADASTNPRIIVMRQDIYVGMAVCSHNANAICTAVFSDVTTTGTVTGDNWEVADIGVEMGDNDPAPLYIAVEDGGVEKVVEHPDNPDAVLATDWRQWDIPLSVLSGANVDLTAVQKMIIGVGSQVAGQDSVGRLYFDNIRLYLPTPPEPNEPNAPLEEEPQE